MASFPDKEVHVVLTARDLGRQIPAEWQERVKHRGRRDYVAFLKALHRNYNRTDWTMPFWGVQHLPRILATWGADLPPERVHLVTVPPSGAPRDLLWKRFASSRRTGAGRVLRGEREHQCLTRGCRGHHAATAQHRAGGA